MYRPICIIHIFGCKHVYYLNIGFIYVLTGI